MAKRRYYRWQNWRVDQNGTTVASERRRHQRKRGERGISNEQARELARLQRRAGLTYSGAGLRESEAAALIRELRNGA